MTGTKTERAQIYVAVDAIIMSDSGKLLLIKRNKEPFKDCYALPGGHVEKDELLKEAIVREVKEETGLDVYPVAMMGVYDDPKRDPRYRLISMVYICRFEKEPNESKFKFDEKEIQEVCLVPIVDVLAGKIKLGFDHEKMVKTYHQILMLGKR